MLTTDASLSKRISTPGDAVLAAPAKIGRFTAVRLEVSEARAAEIALMPGVVRVWPWTPPRLHDERSDQVAAGAIDSDGKLVAPGYADWLAARGLDRPTPAIDVVDTGFDRGDAEDVPEEMLDADGVTRVLYARDYTLDGESHDISGHGTLNASIAAGGASGALDSGGYDFTLGVAPHAPFGSSRIFNDRDDFELFAFYTAVSGPAWSAGARISSNSLGLARQPLHTGRDGVRRDRARRRSDDAGEPTDGGGLLRRERRTGRTDRDAGDREERHNRRGRRGPAARVRRLRRGLRCGGFGRRRRVFFSRRSGRRRPNKA